jgi:hypothetical protein
MKPRHVADLLGFVTYYYAVNRRFPDSRVVGFALREGTRSHQRFDGGHGSNTPGRETARVADTQIERQEELVATR